MKEIKFISKYILIMLVILNILIFIINLFLDFSILMYFFCSGVLVFLITLSYLLIRAAE